MEIIEKRLDGITPYENNPRKNDRAVGPVAESIKAFGWKQPIVIDKDGVIVCGHTRYKAAKKLKLKSVPCVIADDLTEDEIKAYRLADNKVAEQSLWDIEKLDIELPGIDIDMSVFGFDMSAPPEETVEDGGQHMSDIPSVNAQVGDVFVLGDHRLMCGDSTSESHVKTLMDGNRARMLFTSPPYSDLREYEGNKDLSTDVLSLFIPVYGNYCDFECVNLGLMFKNNEVYPYWDAYIQRAHESGMKLLAWNIWDKNSVGSIGMQKHMFPVRHEWIFVFGENPEKTNKTVEKSNLSRIRSKTATRRKPDGTVKVSSTRPSDSKWKPMESIVSVVSETGTIRKYHPATMPVGLPASYIQSITQKGDIICEPFCGSGTTIIACEQLERRCFAMELEPKYIDVIINRWETFTGKKAKKI